MSSQQQQQQSHTHHGQGPDRTTTTTTVDKAPPPQQQRSTTTASSISFLTPSTAPRFQETTSRSLSGMQPSLEARISTGTTATMATTTASNHSSRSNSNITNTTENNNNNIPTARPIPNNKQQQQEENDSKIQAKLALQKQIRTRLLLLRQYQRRQYQPTCDAPSLLDNNHNDYYATNNASIQERLNQLRNQKQQLLPLYPYSSKPISILDRVEQLQQQHDDSKQSSMQQQQLQPKVHAQNNNKIHHNQEQGVKSKHVPNDQIRHKDQRVVSFQVASLPTKQPSDHCPTKGGDEEEQQNVEFKCDCGGTFCCQEPCRSCTILLTVLFIVFITIVLVLVLG